MTKIDVIVPTKNEVDSIGLVVKGIRDVLNHKAEIFIVDENSNDGTIEKALEIDKEIKIIQRIGTGKGNAFKTIQPIVNGDIIVLIDSDGQFDPYDIPTLLKPILLNKANHVLGSRFMGEMEKGAMNWIHNLGNRLFNILISLKYGVTVTDSQTGIRAMLNNVFKSINISSNGFDIETEITIKSIKNNDKIIEVPIKYYNRKIGSKSKLNTIEDGLQILKRILFPNNKFYI